MRRRRKDTKVCPEMLTKFTRGIRKLILTDMRCFFIACLAGVFAPSCSGVHVFVSDEKRYAVPFQSVVLPCHYTTVSTQTVVVQWVYKSYCRDRTRDSFGFSDSLGGGGLGGGALQSNKAKGGGHGTGLAPSYLDCSDSSRTVRTVASVSGSSVTLSEFYKTRDISIINAADLRIGEVQWGDSGVYFCKVIISDDLEGHNEASVELLVLGFSGVPEDLLPDFDLKIMPEWAFVAAVGLGSVLFLLLVGVCWCQCCPHSCCCYVSCWCCPDTCCCPRHLYEAGKGIKTNSSTPQAPAYPPYFVSGLPAMVPIAPPSLVDKVSPVPASDGSLIAAVPVPPVPVPAVYCLPPPQDPASLRVLQYVEKQLADFNPSRSISQQSCSPSELSSLHQGQNGFRQTYRSVQKKALPAVPDQDSRPEPQGLRENRSPDLQLHRNQPSSPHRYRHDPDPQDEPLLPRRYSDDPPPPSQSHRTGRNQRQQNSEEEDKQRWNPRSEHLHRKTYRCSGQTGSLEEFAASYRQRGGRGAERGDEEQVDYEMELLEFGRYPSYRTGPSQHYYNSDHEDNSDREDGSRQNRRHRQYISPLPSPKRKEDRERPVPPPPTLSPPPGSAGEKDYDPTFLDSLLDRKAKLRGPGQGKGGARAEEDSDTPSRGSSKKSSRESNRHRGHSPVDRSVDRFVDRPVDRFVDRPVDRFVDRSVDRSRSGSAPPTDSDQTRTERPAPRPLPANCRFSPPSQSPSDRRDEARDESRDKSRKVQSTLLSRDSLIV